MTRQADAYKAINLAQGFPDFPAPAPLKKAAITAINSDYNQYAITRGSPGLRRAIAEKVSRFNGIEADAEHDITVTCGSTEAMMASILALTNPSEEVVVIEPFYENYLPSIILSGARPRFARLVEPDFRLDEEQLKSTFNDKTKAVIVNTPHNPTGKVFTKTELKLIADLCEDYDSIAITDEIYERIVYDGNEHLSLATIGDMNQRTVTISGISKTYSVTGWRVGYAIAERTLTNAIRKVHDYMTVCAPAPLQEAAIAALNLPEVYYQDLRDSYERRRRLITKSLSEIGFSFFNPEGAYYVLADFSKLSHKSDTEFANWLVSQVLVAVVPGSSFYSRGNLGKRRVRFSFSKKEETLREAVARLKSRI
jgi:aminotransferase